MPIKRLLLYVWISLLFLIAVFVLLRGNGPSSLYTSEIELPAGGKAVLYKDANIEQGMVSDSTSELFVEGKAYVFLPEKAQATYTIITDEGRLVMNAGAVVIDATEDRTSSYIVAEGEASLNLATDTGKRRRDVKMIPGDKCIISPYAKGIIKQNNRDNNYLSWVDFKITYENEKLENVILHLQEVYGREIKLSMPNHFRCKYTGSFDEEPLDQVIDVLAEHFTLEALEQEDGSWELKGEGC